MRHDARLLALPCVGALVGVDEAGRGALCGPVHAAAVLVTPALREQAWWRGAARRVNDSKKLQPAVRVELAQGIRELDTRGVVVAGVACADVPEIERLNILGATQLAMRRALRDVFARAGVGEPDDELPLGVGPDEGPGDDVEDDQAVAPEEPEAVEEDTDPTPAPVQPLTRSRVRVLVDGRRLRRLGMDHEPIVGGDGKSLAIAMASILAKVARDEAMAALASQLPGYGLEGNKGYGTAEHLEALVRLGRTPHHRDLFLRKIFARPRDIEGQMELWGGSGGS
jgi:ribonuclease HII